MNSRNPLVEAASDVATAINACRFKGARLVGTRDGVEIHQRGKPMLLLTTQAAREFARQFEGED